MRQPLGLMQRRLQQEQLQKQLVLVLVLVLELVQQLELVQALRLFSHRKRPKQKQQPTLPKREICSFNYP
jgi:hypothetical protein